LLKNIVVILSQSVVNFTLILFVQFFHFIIKCKTLAYKEEFSKKKILQINNAKKE